MTLKIHTQSLHPEQAMDKAWFILKSNTVFAAALAPSIEAYHKAVTCEKETAWPSQPGKVFNDGNPECEKLEPAKQGRILKFQVKNEHEKRAYDFHRKPLIFLVGHQGIEP